MQCYRASADSMCKSRAKADLNDNDTEIHEMSSHGRHSCLKGEG